MKKKLLTAALLTFCAIALVVSSVLTTIALLTSSAKVSNVFTVGDIKITLYETKVNSAGQPINANGEVIAEKGVDPIKVDTNSYHLIPGETYKKDPTIKILTDNDSDLMYLFVKSRNEIRSAEEGNFIGTNTGTEIVDNVSKTMREQMHANGWVEFVRSGDGVEIVWVYGKRDIVTGDITPFEVNRTSTQTRQGDTTGSTVEGPAGEFRLCEEFTIHQDAQVSLYGAAEVTFTAFAIQSKGFEGDSNEKHALTCSAWEAIKKSFPIDFSIVNPVNPYNGSKTNPYDAVQNVSSPIPVGTQTPGTTNSDSGSEGSETGKTE